MPELTETKAGQQRIAFLYLNTGGGHIAPARALATAIQEKWSDTDKTEIVNGFSDKMKVCRFFFEEGYATTCNYFELGYVFFYQVTSSPLSIRIGDYFVALNGVQHLVDTFKKHRITKVVCLHEVLILVARKALDRINPSIPLITVVTDPFTAHAVWFYEKRMELVVFSMKLRKQVIEQYGYRPEQVHTFPFILSRKFDRVWTPEDKVAIRKRLNIPADSPVILIAGGGEGLKSADRIVAEFLGRRSPATLIVVCGRNKLLRRLVKIQIELYRASNVRVLGFIDFMNELVNLADCVITKAGASTTMEILSMGKPIIFSTFIRGQELGNMLYVVHNGAGWYIKEPRKIMDQADRLIHDPDLQAQMAANIRRLGVRNGLDDLARFIHEF